MRKMFSEKQIKGMIADELRSGELDIVANTVFQEEANWSLNITSFPNITNCDSAVIFCRVQAINGELHFIFNGTITNNTGSSITAYSTDVVKIELPSWIAERIYDIDGKTVAEADADIRISSTVAYISKSNKADISKVLADSYFQITNDSVLNKCQILFNRGAGFTLAAGETIYIEGRVSLDLI